MRTPEQQEEVDRAKDLLEAAFDEEKPEDALELLGKVGDIVGTRMRKRAEFNQTLDQAFEDQVGPDFPTDKDTGRTIPPDGVPFTELPDTNKVKLSGKGLVDAIEHGRKLPVGPDGRQWVRIAEDRPYDGPVIRVTRTEAFVYASSFKLKDLMIILAQTFGVVLPEGLLVTTSASPGAPLQPDEKDRVLEMMAETIARLTIDRDHWKAEAEPLRLARRAGVPDPED
jgi:hypothetical protein